MPHYLGAHNNKLPVCLRAQLAEHCNGIAEVRVQVLFRPFFHHCLNSIQKWWESLTLKLLLLFLVKDHSEKTIEFIQYTLIYPLSHTWYRALVSVPWRFSRDSELPCDKLHWWRLMVSVETSVTNFKRLKFQTKILKILIQWIVLRTLWTTTVRRLT